MTKWYRPAMLIAISIFSLSGNSYGQESKEDVVDVARINAKDLTAHWKSPPPIRLCTDSGVTIQRLNSALDFWVKLGYKFGSVTVDKNSYTCIMGGLEGEISILLFTQDIINGVHIAVTRTKKDARTTRIIQIQIYMNQYAAEKLLVLEHEIGHAMGWSHRREKYHLMNESWKYIGHGTSGITFKDYQYEISKLEDK